MDPTRPTTDAVTARLGLWDALRARWLGLAEPDPADRSATAFRHG